MRLLAASLVVFVGGCHPLACFVPADLPHDVPLVLTSTAEFPKDDVTVLTDDFGVPHIYGNSEPDLAYALGVMHGRDRAFQIYAFIHAGEGRLTEVLGKDLLDVDRGNRLLMFDADAQLAAFAPRDIAMVNAYCAGLNQGAAMAGRSAEMAILGVDWEPVTPRDILAIVRLQQWDQGVGFHEEMARYRLVKALGADSPVVKELMQDTPSGGVPIVGESENQAAPFAPTAFHAPPPSATLASSSTSSARASSEINPLKRALIEDLTRRFTQGGTGASNSWSVDPAHTDKGVAVLANDPHLSHGAPGIFYMADLHGPDFVAAGGTFPGIPAVLIGHGQHVAWGVTNAFADTQDVVVIQRHEGGTGYVVDGQDYAFGLVKQRFVLGHGKDASVVEETWKTTLFGPVLPPGYGSYGGSPPLVADGEDLALLWTATAFNADNGRSVSAFWDLAKAKNVTEATAAIQDFSSPAMSVNLAFTDGTIAYRLSGIVPVRGDDQRPDFPRIGNSKKAGWVGRLPVEQKPYVDNPAKGYIVASNQRVVENGVGSQADVGFEGARPFRAMRIDARIKALLADGKKAKTDDLLAIQQDITAIDAQTLAPLYAARCPTHVTGHSDDVVKRFCAAVGAFDGVYTVDAHALPFARLNQEVGIAILRAHVDDALASDLLDESFVDMALQDAVVKEAKGDHTGALLDDPKTPEREGIDGFVARAIKPALDAVVAEAGGSDDDWRWGKLHTLSLRGVLSAAPVVGFLFETSAREESGAGSVPRAEQPDFGNKMRVSGGAGLRLIAEMTDPPTIRMVNDSGESGHFGAKHLEDQYPLWHDGKPRVLSLDQKTAQAGHEGGMTIKPRKKK